MAVELSNRDYKIILVNVHAPNVEIEKAEHFSRLGNIMNGWKDVILIGDFNVALTKIDVGVSMVYRPDRGRRELAKLMNRYKLIDIWREMHRKEIVYSRRQMTQGQIKQSRIDLVLSTREIRGKVEKVFYKEVGYSDNKSLTITLTADGVDRGSGIWVLNANILNEKEYCESVKPLINGAKKDGLYEEHKRILVG